MHDSGVHVEITFLIIPQTNDGEDEIRGMSQYIKENLGPDVPLHLSRFHPAHKFRHLPPTPIDTLLRAREIAQESGLRYVFVGNVRGEGYEDTVCPGCGEHVVKRSGYDITGWSLDGSNRCTKCGEPIPIVGKRE